jgi:cellulose synthase (UDP-forming)
MQVRFAAQTLQDEGNIVRAVLGRADAWVDWDEVRQDKPLRSLAEVARSIGGLFRGDSQISAFVRRRARGSRPPAPPRPTAEPATPAPAVEAARRVRGRGAARRAAAALLALAIAAPGAALAQVNLRGAPPPPAPLQPGPQGLPLSVPPQSPGVGSFGAPATQGAAVPLAPRGQPVSPFGQPAAFGQPAPATQVQLPVGGTGVNTGLPPLPQAQTGFTGSIPSVGSFGTPTGAPGSSRTETRTLRQLGLRAPMQLRGASDLQGILFGVRGDEVVTGARLVLQGATSPALIPNSARSTWR